MARLDSNPYPFPAGNWSDRFQAQHDALAKLRKRSAALPEGEVKGALLSFQVADGYAYYVVTKASPLTLAHVPYLDEYSVMAPMIRGLRKSDVVDMLRRERAYAKLFSR